MPSIYFIPSGPKNLQSLFPSLPWYDIDEYYINSGSLLTTPRFKVVGCDEDVELSFVNYLGGVDNIPIDAEIEHETKSTTYQRPLSYPLQKGLHGTSRLSIKSTDNYTGLAVLEEGQMKWMDELFDSPLAWIQTKGTQGQSDFFTPVIITDQSTVKRKKENRFVYEVTVKFSLSHERITLAN